MSEIGILILIIFFMVIIYFIVSLYVDLKTMIGKIGEIYTISQNNSEELKKVIKELEEKNIF